MVNPERKIGPGSYYLQISQGGVTIRPAPPAEKPLGLKLKSAEESPVINKVRDAYIGAAVALLKYNLPDQSEIPTINEVADKLGELDGAIHGFLAARRWSEKRRLAILIELTQEDLSPLIRSRSISPLNWERCQNLLAQEIEGSVQRFQEEQYQQKQRTACTP